MSKRTAILYVAEQFVRGGFDNEDYWEARTDLVPASPSRPVPLRYLEVWIGKMGCGCRDWRIVAWERTPAPGRKKGVSK